MNPTIRLLAVCSGLAAAVALGTAWAQRAPLLLDPNPSTFRVPAPPGLELRQKAQQATVVVNYLAAGTTTAFGDHCISWTSQAQAAFSYAANVWASQLQSSVPITIDACYSDNMGAGVLGEAGPNTFFRNFTGAPTANVWYPVALANALAGTDLKPGESDIQAAFSSTFNWYYGTDGKTPLDQVDFVSVVLHEIGHGLGFLGSMDVASGLGTWGNTSGYAFRFDQFAQDASAASLLTYPASGSGPLAAVLQSNAVYFSGTNANLANSGLRVALYAPPTWQDGSSYSHLAESFNNTPNALMTYSLASGESIHSPGPVTLGILKDMGWPTTTYALNVTKSGAGSGTVSSTPNGINCGSTCSVSFAAGTSITLAAMPAPGSVFAGWSGACTGTGSCTVALNAASSVNAAFAIGTTTLTVVNAGNGTVTSSPAGIDCGATCSATYPIGTAVALTATPAAGMVFNGWSGACTGKSTCTITLSGLASVTASFGPPPSADLVVSQSVSPSTPLAGKDIVFTVNASNNGTALATTVTVRDTLPAGTVYVWSSGGCAVSGNVVTCSTISVAPGIVVPFTIVARPVAAGTITNTVDISATEPDPDLTNNTAAVTLAVGSAPAANVVTRYRLYSPVTHEHHFTTDLNEYNFLGTQVGSWQQEGASGKVLDNPGSFNGVTAVPYYRVYHAGLMLHHWTTDPNEYYTLSKYFGWSAEGVDGYLLPSFTTGATQLYRLVFPNSSLHHWTTDASEYQILTSVYGWIGEGNSGFVIQ